MSNSGDPGPAERVSDLAYRELAAHSGTLLLGLSLVYLLLSVTTWALGQFGVGDLVVIAVLALVTALAWRHRIPDRFLPSVWTALAVLVVAMTCLQMIERESMMQLGYIIVACAVYPPLALFWRPALLGGVACVLLVAATGLYSYPRFGHDMWGKLEPIDAVLQTAVAVAAGGLALHFRRSSLSGTAVTTSALETRAMTDGLTGVLNRRGIEELGAAMVQRAQALGQPAFVLFVDINGLKAVNDTCGHEVGDQVIRLVAQAARQVVREGDLLGRWGGDEFVIIGLGSVPDPPVVGDRLAEVLQREGAADLWSEGVSLGGASGIDSYEALVSAADNDMYRRRQLSRGLSRPDP